MTVSTLLPIVVAGGAVYLVHRHGGMKLWHALVCVLAGLILAPTFIGTDITTFLSQITGGRFP
jgi:hypothetical protein